jgi:tetratricopeptide (TPR) repeat protein
MDRLFFYQTRWMWVAALLLALLILIGARHSARTAVRKPAHPEIPVLTTQAAIQCQDGLHRLPENGVVPAAHLFAAPPLPSIDTTTDPLGETVIRSRPTIERLPQTTQEEPKNRGCGLDQLRRLPLVIAVPEEDIDGVADSGEEPGGEWQPNSDVKDVTLGPPLDALDDRLQFAGDRSDASAGGANSLGSDEAQNLLDPEWSSRPLTPVEKHISPASSDATSQRVPPMSRTEHSDAHEPKMLSRSPLPDMMVEQRDSPAPEPTCSDVQSHPSPNRMALASPVSTPLHEPRRDAFPLEQVGRPEPSVTGLVEKDRDDASQSWRPVEIPVERLSNGTTTQPQLSEKSAAILARQLEAFSQRAEDLAARGAHYAARAETIKALRVVTQTLDTQIGSDTHSRALANAMRALQEAEDFTPAGSHLEAELNLGRLVERHRTPVLRGENLQRVTSFVAQQRYLTYAQEQLVVASGRLPAASRALFDLGRICMALGNTSSNTRSLHLPKAVTLYQAALMVNGRNALAANELGVLLARSGQLEDARAVLLHGASVGPEPEIWHNLAVVHHRLGEVELAQRAQLQARMTTPSRSRPPEAIGNSNVRWVDASEFSAAGRAGQVYQ